MSLPLAPPDRIKAGPFMLRAMVEDDWAVEVALAQDADVLRWTHYRPGMTEDTARERLGRALLAGAAADTYRYVITDGLVALGVAGVFADPGEMPEIYFALVPSGRHRGAATLAARALGDWVLENGTEVVSLVIFEGNAASEAVARRSGFSFSRRASTEHQGLPTETTVWERMARPAGGSRLRGGS